MECDDLRTELLEHGIELESEVVNDKAILWLKTKKHSEFYTLPRGFPELWSTLFSEKKRLPQPKKINLRKRKTNISYGELSDDSIEPNDSDGTEFTVGTESLEYSDDSEGTECSAVNELAELMDETSRLDEISTFDSVQNSHRNLRKHVAKESHDPNEGMETESTGSGSICSVRSFQVPEDTEYQELIESKVSRFLGIMSLNSTLDCSETAEFYFELQKTPWFTCREWYPFTCGKYFGSLLEKL